MPLANYQSVESALAELEGVYSADRRYLDLCLVVRAKSTGEELLVVGGRWDRHIRAYLDPDPPDLRPVELLVNDNQIEVVRAFARWLRARIEGGPRVRLLLTGGNRRGGKSWIVTALACATCLAIPEAIVWLVSPTLEKREELERYVKEHVPPEWRDYRARELRFAFPTGASIKNVTGDDAEALKRGECDLVVYNEPQQMGEDVLLNGAPAIIDKGGLVLFAGNPAKRRKGVWFTRLWLAVEKGEYQHGEVYRLDRRDNPDVDAAAGKDVGQLLRLVSPEAARADDEGLFVEPGQYAYAEHWDEKRNAVAKIPAGLSIITPQMIRRAGAFGAFEALAGVDFNGWPFNAGVGLEIAGDPADPTFYVTKCLMTEGDEDRFLDEAFSLWPQAQTLWIGDASGKWQNAKHTGGRCSFDKFLARRWHIIPPLEKRTDRGLYPSNPPVEDRINLVNSLLDRGRLVVCMDGAKAVAEALQRCEVKPDGKPRGRYSHLTDALGYPLWWCTPRPMARSGPPPRGAMRTGLVRPTGPRVL